jgi:predicted Rossmann fold nucleotide-binding protein DprA/Smf involved in DNA uptake
VNGISRLIISGLPRGVVIIEAGDKCEGLITTRHGAEQGRTAFAEPGLNWSRGRADPPSLPV